MKHTLAVLVQNHAGVLSRVSGLFSRRGYNIDSLAVGITEVPGVSRMTIVVDADETIMEQITKQMNKLIDVIKIWDITSNAVSRELCMIKVRASATQRGEIIQIANIFRAKVIDINPDELTIECTGDLSKIAALAEMLQAFGILEMARTGALAVERGRGHFAKD